MSENLKYPTINNICMYTTSNGYCDTVINDDEDFCSLHKNSDYDTMFKKKVQTLRGTVNIYTGLLPYCLKKEYICIRMYELVKKSVICLSDNEFNKKLSDFFLKAGYHNVHSLLCTIASKFHERRALKRKEKEKKSIMTTDDKIILYV